MYYFIVNPNSRSGRGLVMWNQLKTILNEKQISYSVYLTEHVGHATAIASEITSASFPDQEERTIVALGGDGTLNEVVNGIRLSSKISLAYIPCGSGNDFCRGMKLPKKSSKVLKSLLSETHINYIDYGILSYNDGNVPMHRRFVVSTGAGFDADVCYSLAASRIKRFLNNLHIGKLSYLFIGIKRIILSKGASGYIIIDNEKKIPLGRIRFIAVHNQRYEGGGFCFAPKASPEDGLLNICIVSDCSKLRMVKILIASILRKHEGMNGVRAIPAKSAIIHLDQPYNIHTDGEVLPAQTDISVQCECRKIKFVW